MPDGIKSYFDFAVTGADKVAAMEGTLGRVERTLGTSLPAAATRTTVATQHVAEAHAISGEKMARYGTVALALSGNMQRLGVQNEILSRTIGVGAEIMTGATGGIYLAVAAVGVLATAISVLVMKHRENEQAIKDSHKAMLDAIDANITLAALKNPTGEIARVMLARTEQEAASNVRGLEATYGDISQRRNFGGYLQKNTALIKGFAPAMSFVPYNAKELAALDKQANETAMALVVAQGQQLKIQAAKYTIEDTYRAPDNAKSIKDIKGVFNLWDSGIRDGGMRARTRSSLGVPGQMGPADLGKPAKDVYVSIADASRAATDAQIANLQVLKDTHRDTYNAMSGVSMATSKASSLFMQRLIEGENLSRLRGLTIAKYVAAGGAAAVLEGIAAVARTKAAEQIALALGTPEHPGWSGSHFASAVAWGALSGAASGAAAGMQSRATAQFDRETTKQDAASGAASGNGSGSYGASSSANPGVRVGNSGASVGTVNYNFIVTYQGGVVYGDGGTRDWFYREFVPLINEGIATGAISRN
jgi:hypothetical protein